MDRTNVASDTVWEDEVGYSRAVRVGEQREPTDRASGRTDGRHASRVGDRIEVSGTTATDENGDIVGAGDPYAQASQAIANIERALEQTGATLADVVRTRMFVTSVDDYEAVGRAHSEAFDDVRPATSMYEVAALVDPDMLVEIEATAIVAE